jgi:hypothetical protein
VSIISFAKYSFASMVGSCRPKFYDSMSSPVACSISSMVGATSGYSNSSENRLRSCVALPPSYRPSISFCYARSLSQKLFHPSTCPRHSIIAAFSDLENKFAMAVTVPRLPRRISGPFPALQQ